MKRETYLTLIMIAFIFSYTFGFLDCWIVVFLYFCIIKVEVSIFFCIEIYPKNQPGQADEFNSVMKYRTGRVTPAAATIVATPTIAAPATAAPAM